MGGGGLNCVYQFVKLWFNISRPLLREQMRPRRETEKEKIKTLLF